MRVYTCAPTWDAMLTTIYEAFECKLGHENIKLMIDPVEQFTLFDEYIYVESDKEKALKVVDAINKKISSYVYHQMAVTSMAYEEDVLDNIYHVLILGFNYGPDVLNMMQYKDVMRNYEIRKRVESEACRFKEFIRFHKIGDVYVAHIEPKSRIAEYLGPIFEDRMPSENFIIVDDVHFDAVVHYADEPFFMRKLDNIEYNKILNTEKINDEYTDLWRVFFNSIAIKERTNEKCQMLHFPKWTRVHAVEFMK